jgi:hypothetical protein
MPYSGKSELESYLSKKKSSRLFSRSNDDLMKKADISTDVNVG